VGDEAVPGVKRTAALSDGNPSESLMTGQEIASRSKSSKPARLIGASAPGSGRKNMPRPQVLPGGESARRRRADKRRPRPDEREDELADFRAIAAGIAR